MKIRTIEQDTGLWEVFQGEQSIGFIWEHDAESRIWAKIQRKPYVPDETIQPRFIALDDWVDGIMPGNPLEGCDTWHKALHAVCDWAKQQAKREAMIAERRAMFAPVVNS